MYSAYFRLSEPPFSLTPDPRFLFMSERHREGLAHLLYGIQQPGGFVQLTGEIGSGKTTLCRGLVKQLPPQTDVALILNPRLTVLELLASVCDELSVPYPAGTKSIKDLIDALNRRLLEAHAQGRRTVLIIDEAQNLRSDVLEQIRLLTNLETSQEKLLQVILIGQPELLSILKRKRLRQLAQRITARYHLGALSRSETIAYIQHRLSIAGRTDPLFTAAAMRSVYRLSRGVPRLVNIICDRALLGAYALDRQWVSAGIVRRASRETRGIVPWYRQLRPAWTAVVAALAVLMVGSAALVVTGNRFLHRRDPEPAAAMTSEARAVVPKPRQPDPLAANPPEIAAVPARTVPPGPRLADILADASVRGTSASSFTSLYSRLGIKLPSNGSEPGCNSARQQGFGCLFRTGNWTRLRYFDLPAILELSLPNGIHTRATLVGLGDKTATLSIGEREYTFPLAEIDSVWDGSFILVWKLPFAAHQISPGARGEDVAWVRQALDTLEGKAPGSAGSDVYDESLRRRVLAFQRERSLPQDGLVGSATLVRLTRALEGANAPSILPRRP